MSLPNAMRVLFGAILCCVPAAASIADDNPVIRVGGAEPKGPTHFVTAEMATVSLAVHANRGDSIWLYAIGPGGEVISLALVRASADGRAYGDFRVPMGAGGKSYEVRASAMNLDGQVFHALPIRIDVKKAASPIDPVLLE